MGNIGRVVKPDIELEPLERDTADPAHPVTQRDGGSARLKDPEVGLAVDVGDEPRDGVTRVVTGQPRDPPRHAV